MKKWVILIGNGLGLSLDASFFSLEKGMSEAWNKLDDQEKTLFEALLGKTPQNENDLLSLQYLSKAIRSVKDRAEKMKIDDLSLASIPNIVERFRKYVAESYICHPEKNSYFKDERFINFAKQLALFILTHGEKGQWNNICLATVNYDNLLYTHYLKNSYRCSSDKSSKYLIGDNTEGALQDGFCKRNGKIIFDPICLYHEPKRQHLGYYLHLHGSVKFHSINDQIQKIKDKDINKSEITTKDIVLANSEEKLDTINESPLLKHYWDIFEKHIFECDTLIILGCSGQDKHINNLIKKRINIQNQKKSPNIIIGIQKSNLDYEKKFGLMIFRI